MRIAYLHGGSIPSYWANNVHVMRMCDAFASAGHDITLYAAPGTYPADDAYAYYGVRHRFPIRTVAAPDHSPAGYRQRAERVRESLIRDGVPDLIFGRDPYCLAVAADVAPFVYEVHQIRTDLSPPETEQRLLAEPRLARVVVITHALAQDLCATYPQLDPAAVLVAPDCADPPRPATEPVRLPGRAGVPRVGYVGHLYDGRGIDLILDLAERLPGLDFHLVGGTPEDRDRWEQPCALANVYFHGHRPPAELPGYFPQFDVVLAPYEEKVYLTGRLGETGRWTSPMKLFEYMSHGRAIVVSDLPVLHEVMTDRVNCLIRPPADPPAWADAVLELVGDDELRRSLGDEARRQVLDRYTWRRRADVVLAGLDPSRVVGGAGPA
ncbi:glycosyltransferase family 4 protein [Embleya sp. NPDC008237]|uniref:glycosyltransferase family 4 protein n=1 Tax=Embleya sp. NPDC008237 TaxID=3363978 RepID=UPI0036EAA1BE